MLVEKPATLQADEFDSLIAERDAGNVLIAEAFMIVHHPQWQRVRQMVADGAIGQLRHISAAFSFDNVADKGNIRNQSAMGGGALRDIGVYVIGAARYVTGTDMTDISARIRWESRFDATSHIDGMLGDVTYSAYVSTRMHPTQEMTFHGSEGRIRLTAPFNPMSFGEAQIETEQPGFAIRTERFPSANHYVLQVEAFGATVRTGVRYPCPLEFSRGTQETIDTVLSVAKSLG